MRAIKPATAAIIGGSLLVLSGLTLAGTVIVLTVATPLLVIISPVLVPGGITMCLLVTGFLASGGFGVAAVTVLAWLYNKYTTDRRTPGADMMDETAKKLALEIKEESDQFAAGGGSSSID